MQQRWKNSIGLDVSAAKAKEERGLVMTTTLISLKINNLQALLQQ